MVQQSIETIPAASRPARLLYRDQRLTRREVQVVIRVVTGASNAEIARDLGVSLATAKRHLANVMLKWHCANRTQVAIKALRLAGWPDADGGANVDRSSSRTTRATTDRFP